MVEIQLAAGIVGALVMLVDALRREYESPKALPIALAVMGLISFGGTSALYYLIWGWKPTKLPTALRASGLCERCIETTLDKAAPGTATHNLIGTCLIGAADRCPSCGSTVRTVWIMFIFPIVPFASYRVLTLGRASFIRANYIGRRLPQLQWGQIWPVLAITWSVLACFLAAALR